MLTNKAKNTFKESSIVFGIVFLFSSLTGVFQYTLFNNYKYQSLLGFGLSTLVTFCIVYPIYLLKKNKSNKTSNNK